MSLLGAILLGLIAGIIAKAIMPGKDPGGVIITIILGIVGSMVGHFIAGRGFTAASVGDEGFLTRLLFAVIGALVVLAIYRLIAGRSARA